MSPLIPRPQDQKQLKRKRKTKQKKCITKKKPKTILFENKKVQKTVKKSKKDQKQFKKKIKEQFICYFRTRCDLTFLFVVVSD